MRNVYGEAEPHKYEDVKMSDNMTDGSMMDANSHFIAFSYATTAGGSVAVIDATNFHRLPVHIPLITGHTAPVLDVKFSPFRTNLLATSSDDSTVRLWEIAQGGAANGVTEQQKFTGHSKKVTCLSFSPVVEELIASSSYDNSIHVWNILNGASYSHVNMGDGIYSLDWNYNSSLLGATTKNKNLSIIDPRTNTITMKTPSLDGPKSQKMRFLDQNFLFSVGFTKNNERALKLFDMRNFDECLQTLVIDSSSGVLSPYYDSDTGLIYLPGKGETTIKYYDFSSSTLKYCNEYKSSIQQKSLAFFPKRTMNYNKLEIARFAKSYGSHIEYVSFYSPKRNEGYDESVYPDCFAGEPALGVEEWLKGENREPIRKKITSLENSWNVTAQNFEKKVEKNEECKKAEPVDSQKVR